MTENIVVKKIYECAKISKNDSDFTYFFTLMLGAEAGFKLITQLVLAAIDDDKERNRYRLEHKLVRANGIGEWSEVLEDCLTGPASHFLCNEARSLQRELTKKCTKGDWQYEALIEMAQVLNCLNLPFDDLSGKAPLKTWFRMMAALRNGTKGHGATQPSKTGDAGRYLKKSLDVIFENCSAFEIPCAHLYQNLSGKYRVSKVSGADEHFSHLKKANDISLNNGLYVSLNSLRQLPFLETDAELSDFYFANGAFRKNKFELLSYFTDDKREGDGSMFNAPPGQLPESETEGLSELDVMGECFSNAPKLSSEYVVRELLEQELTKIIKNDRHPVITLVGRGGIGKTSLALHVIHEQFSKGDYDAIVWMSARDVDLTPSGPKHVRQAVVSQKDVADHYSKLVLPEAEWKTKAFNSSAFFEKQLQKSDFGKCLFVFDNFETMQDAIDTYIWIDTHIRLPNKVLITTRLRDFKGDYPIEVGGMEEPEARKLITQTSQKLEITSFLSDDYIEDILSKSEGHPYVIKILLGEIAKSKRPLNIERLVAGSEDVLTALFERTYAILSPCAQRAFLTLAAWNSVIPRLALQAVLFRSTKEIGEVEEGIELLIQFSLAEIEVSSIDGAEILSLPLAARIFGKKKLNIHSHKIEIQSDAEILQMFEPAKKDSIGYHLTKRIEKFVTNLAKKSDGFDRGDCMQILESICLAHPPGWLVAAKWRFEDGGIEDTIRYVERFLENPVDSNQEIEAWSILRDARFAADDELGGIQAWVELSQIEGISFYEVSNCVSEFNRFFRDKPDFKDQKMSLGVSLSEQCRLRQSEAVGADFSRLAWLELNLGNEDIAKEYIRIGLKSSPDNPHIVKLASTHGIT